MTWLYLHLMSNHFPIILTFLGTAACGLGAARKNNAIWNYGLVTLALGAVMAIPSWISGYQAHYVVENQLGLPEGLVEPHELLAEATMWVMIPLAGLAAFAWWRRQEEPKRGPSPSWVRPTILAVALTGSVMLGVTALFGGRIAHGKPKPITAADSAARAQQNWTPVPAESLKTR